MQRIPRRAEGEGKIRGISRRDPIRRCTSNGPVGCKLHRFARQQCTADKLDALRLQHGAVLVLCPLVHRKHTVCVGGCGDHRHRTAHSGKRPGKVVGTAQVA